MGNTHEIEKIEDLRFKNKKDKKKQKLKVSDPLYKFLNYEGDITKMSLIAASPQIREILMDNNINYNIKLELPPKDEIERMAFEDKVLIFKSYLQRLKIDWRQGAEHININRDEIINLSIHQFKLINPYKELKINFNGEVNQDAGGLIREWLTVIFKELQSEKEKLFEKADTLDYSIKIISDLAINERNIEIFNFIGKIIAKALLENLTVNTCFNKYIYKIILNEKIDFKDLVFIDQGLYHSLEKIKNMENVEDLEIYFNIEYVDNKGKLISEDLITNGSNIKVTKNNLDYYIETRINNIIWKNRILLNEIKKGLISLIPENLIKIFTSEEFELLLNGTPFIDVEDWRVNTSYNGYYTNDKIIMDFWDIIIELPQEKLARLLQFCTGSSRVPIGGFRSLESNRGNKSPFCITKVEYEKNGQNFIRAHTCFNRLNLPNFPTKEELQNGIDFILENEILGFGID